MTRPGAIHALLDAALDLDERGDTVLSEEAREALELATAELHVTLTPGDREEMPGAVAALVDIAHDGEDG